MVIGDLDATRLAETAARLDAEHPGRVSHVAGDASDAAHVAALIEAAGEVDAYFANAGVFKGFGLEATDDEWALSWDVNVKAHVVAARALVPGWLERGAGCFVSTASAAGLLTQLGSPTYSTTKHAAVGFAEWLAATYGDRGVQVCCLCPMGVRTDMLVEGETSAVGDARLGMKSVVSAGETLSPLAVADVLLAGGRGRHVLRPAARRRRHDVCPQGRRHGSLDRRHAALPLQPGVLTQTPASGAVWSLLEPSTRPQCASRGGQPPSRPRSYAVATAEARSLTPSLA